MDDEINKLKDFAKGELVFGNQIKFNDDLSILPVYRVKISYLSLDSKLKKDISGSSGSVSLIPLCFIEIKKTGIKVHSLSHDFSMTEVMDKAPDLLSSLGKIFDLDKLNKN